MSIPPSYRLLLISSSTVAGTGYLDHAESEIRDHLHGVDRILFIPYALADHEGYFRKARERFVLMGFEVTSIHTASDPRLAVSEAQAIFIGGGNTFRLLKSLYDQQLLDPIRERVRAGMPYMGASAGSNVAGPTIRTTNDMPIVEPPSLAALNLFPYQINPHYLDPDPASTHMGETREERLLQYLEENETPVVAIREGSYLRVQNGEIWLKGRAARIFRPCWPPYELAPPAKIEF
ncbi:MAG TPA: dipeptidase PepE [Terriglobales bacterium]|nr:dipeptidase PepE [Terriglobales bacterium]